MCEPLKNTDSPRNENTHEYEERKMQTHIHYDAGSSIFTWEFPYREHTTRTINWLSYITQFRKFGYHLIYNIKNIHHKIQRNKQCILNAGVIVSKTIVRMSYVIKYKQ